MTYFYEKCKVIDTLKKKGHPSEEDHKALKDTIENDELLAIHFYGGYDNVTFPHNDWILLLLEAGEFNDLETASENIKRVHKYKADFLREAAKERPEDVLRIITIVQPKDQGIQRYFVDALLEMPIELCEKGSTILEDYLSSKQRYIWHWIGEGTAKVMLKLMDYNPGRTFEIAKILLEIWEQEETEKAFSRDVCSRFKEYEYSELISKYYQQVCERYPVEGIRLLIRILDDYISKVNQDKDYDISELYYIRIKNLSDQDFSRRDEVTSILIKAICQLLLLIKDTEQIEKMLAWLKGSDKAIFRRIEIFYLSKIGEDRHKDRIKEILLEHTYFRSSCYINEYNLLLNEKGLLVYDEIKPQIEQWLQEDYRVDNKVDFDEWFEKYNEKKATDEDVEIYENRIRANRLYSIKKVLGDLFEKYRKAAGATEEDVKPFESEEARFIAGDEGTPLTTGQMNLMKVNEVLEYVLEPSNYNKKSKEFRFHTPEDALGYAFQMAVKARPVEFIQADIALILKLPETFLSRYFYGLWEALRESRIDGFHWDTYLEIAHEIAKKYNKDKEIGPRLKSLIGCIKEGFNEQNKIEYTKERLYEIFHIAELLLNVKEEKDISSERDPIQIRCNSVAGESLLVFLNLGVIFKQNFEKEYKNTFQSKLEQIFNKVLDEIKTSWMVCTFGSDLPRIYWLMPDWIEKRLNTILSDENWKMVWGTYLYWGMPSENLYQFLKGKGIYTKAIQKMDLLETSESGEKPSEELAKHFVIAYFNGWVESYGDENLQEFLNIASDELLGYTARFFTTGFKDLCENPDTNANDRLKTYWEKRLEVINENPEKHQKESSSLAEWIVNCPLDRNLALSLEEKTLELCKNVFIGNFEGDKCIQALCSYANIDPLKVVHCIRVTINRPYDYMYIDHYKGELRELFRDILNDETASPELIQETIMLADDLGRLGIYEYKDVFETLYARLKKTE